MNRLVKTWLNADLMPHTKEYEINTLPSETIPEQCLSIREILDRYTRGLPVSGTVRIPHFDEDDTLPDITKLDFAERQEYEEMFRQELQELAERDKKRKADFAAWQKAKEEADRRDREAKEKKEQEKAPDSTNNT